MTEMDTVQAELEAMKVIVDALRPLTSESVKKVLRFVNDTYPSKGSAQVTSDEGQENQPTFVEFHELFETARPNTGPERALVAAYWLQIIQGNEEWDSLNVNRELRSMDKESKNITRDLDVLVRRLPRWVHPNRKEGASQQSRKMYKLTNEGIKAVQRMIAKNQASLSVESE